MRVLITGVGGFVGSHAVEHLLLNTDWHLIGLDSFRHKGDPLRLRHVISHERLKIFCHDLNAPISKRLETLIGPIDYILNIASESHVPRSIVDPVPFVQNNVNLMLNILEYARREGCQKFIHCGTDEVFGPALEGQFHFEWDPQLPSSPYSASKAMQNNLAFAYWRTYGLPLIITHTKNMFGERQEGEKFIPTLIYKISKGEVVKIHGSTHSIGKRYYIHCRNLASAWLHLLTQQKPALYRGGLYDQMQLPDAFNIVDTTEMDNLSLAKLVAKIIDKPLHYEFVDFEKARAGHDPRYALDGSKMASLGWSCPVPFEESLERTVKWTLQHKEWLL